MKLAHLHSERTALKCTKRGMRHNCGRGEAVQQRQKKKKHNEYTHLTHYLDVGNPPDSIFVPLTRQDGQDKVARFGQRLSDQEGVRFISCHQELFSIRPRQVAMIPPGTRAQTLMVHKCTFMSHMNTSAFLGAEEEVQCCAISSLSCTLSVISTNKRQRLK